MGTWESIGTKSATASLLLTVALLAALTAVAGAASDPPAEDRETAWLLRDAIHRVTAGHHAPAAQQVSARAEGYDVLHYELAVQLDAVADTLSGQVAVTIASEMSGLDEVLLHLTTLIAHSARIGLTPLSFTHVGEELVIALDRGYDPGESFTVEVGYSGDPDHEAWGGFWFYSDMAFNLGVGLYTDPPSMGRYWFPCFDEPGDKATITAHYTVPEEWSALGNGLLTNTVPHPQEQTVTYTWTETHPTSTYLVAIAAADWRIIPDPVYPELIQHYVLPIDSSDAVGSFQNVHTMMDAFTTRYAPYQYDKFAFVGVRQGDMEHQTCVAHNRQFINGGTFWDPLLAHELSHHWWGDWVTITDWRDIWLSEGFATYSEAIFKEHSGGIEAYHAYMNTSLMDYYMNSGETFPIWDPESMWGATSYEKGGSVLHMLRHVVGESTFFDILQTWGATYGFANVETTDFVAIAESESGMELGWFFDQWIYDAGYPNYDWSWTVHSGAADTLLVRVEQVQSIGPVFTMPVDFRVALPGGDTTVTATVSESPQTVAFAFDEVPTAVEFDPERWILCRKNELPTGVEMPAGPRDFDLLPAGPNPFHVATTMRLIAPAAAGPMELNVFEVSGRKLRELYRGEVAGERLVHWDGRDDAGRKLASGVYLMQARLGEQVRSHRVILLH